MERASTAPLFVLRIFIALLIPLSLPLPASAETNETESSKEAPSPNQNLAALAPTPTPAPESTVSSRITAQVVTWQETLRLEKTGGAVEGSIANYKGYGIGYERHWRTESGGWILGAWIGTGEASGGGTSTSFAYKQGSISWTMLAIEPIYVKTFSDRIDFLVGLTAYYRNASWPTSSTIRVTPTQDLNGAVFGAIDLSLTTKLVLRQSIGFSSLEAGPFWRFALAYQL